MLFKQRIIHGDNGTLIDLSAALNDLFASNGVLPIVALEDYIYIGSDLPFCHRYFKSAVANDQAAAISEIAIWDGNSWTPAVDVIDGTSVGGKTLAQSGIIQWTTNRNSAWTLEASTEDMTSSGISTLKIYDFHWVRIKFSANLKATTALSYVGHRFSSDAELAGYYPDLLKTEVLGAFQSGKTSWDDQHCLAAEEIIVFLRKKQIIWSPNQLLNWEQFTLASVHKTAEIINSAFPGDDAGDIRKAAEKKFLTMINQGIFEVDRNQDGHVNRYERASNAGFIRQ